MRIIAIMAGKVDVETTHLEEMGETLMVTKD